MIVKMAGKSVRITGECYQFAPDLEQDKFVNMLKQYYRLRGWDEDTGLPRSEILSALGLDDLMPAFQQ